MIAFPSRLALLRIVCPGFFLLAGSLSCALGQAVPAVGTSAPTEGFQFPTVNGSLQYSVTAAESLVFGYNGQPGTGTSAVTSFSGDLAFLSKSKTNPFSAVYSGGYLVGSGQEPSSPFQNLALSQVIKTRSYDFILADTVSYLPQTPSSGLSGIPGLGDVGIGGGPIADPQLGILTTYSTRVSNTASGTAVRTLTGSTSLHATGTYGIERFLGGSIGLDNNQVSGTGGVLHRINARSSAGADVSYSHFSYTDSGLNFDTQTLLFQFTRQLTRQLTLNVGAGPQRVNSGNQPSINVSFNASLGYTAARTNYILNYSRGVTAGDGVVAGAHTDTVNLSAQRALSRAWDVSGLLGYNRSNSLPNGVLPSFSNDTVVASGQVSRSLNHALFLFASYTLQRQSVAGTAAVNNPFNGLSQILGFGITYAPRPFLGRR